MNANLFNYTNVTPFFQTIVSVAEGRKTNEEGIEILARIKHHNTYLSPCDFIGEHICANKLNKLTKILLLKTLNHLWPMSEKPNFISFNVCAQQLHSDARSELMEILKSLHVEFEKIGVYLVMEITEDKKLEETNGVIRTLKKIKSMGIKLAIDDYGRYFSSPSRGALLENIDILKTDRSLINAPNTITMSLISISFLKHALDIAKITNCKVIVEGIERESQLELLHDSKIWYQGYYFSHPRPIDEL
ncbi:EAL domain-containing protein [Aeromonas jandaei]|uniref:EAL domain-containing protein n=1 Tax=Aeromonas jandaei TaxID=650 RepID=UPI003D1CED51